MIKLTAQEIDTLEQFRGGSWQPYSKDAQALADRGLLQPSLYIRDLYEYMKIANEIKTNWRVNYTISDIRTKHLQYAITRRGERALKQVAKMRRYNVYEGD